MAMDMVKNQKNGGNSNNNEIAYPLDTVPNLTVINT